MKERSESRLEEVSENAVEDGPLGPRVRGPRGDEAGRGPRDMRWGLVRSGTGVLVMDDLEVGGETTVGDGGGFMSSA